jgi:hypothetical protein
MVSRGCFGDPGDARFVGFVRAYITAEIVAGTNLKRAVLDICGVHTVPAESQLR